MDTMLSRRSYSDFARPWAIVLVLVLSVAVLGGCSDDSAVVSSSNNGGKDAGWEVGEGDADSGAGLRLPPSRASHLCAAAGRTSGGGYRGVHCTAPVEISGNTIEGGNYQLQAGAFRVVTPR